MFRVERANELVDKQDTVEDEWLGADGPEDRNRGRNDMLALWRPVLLRILGSEVGSKVGRGKK